MNYKEILTFWGISFFIIVSSFYLYNIINFEIYYIWIFSCFIMGLILILFIWIEKPKNHSMGFVGEYKQQEDEKKKWMKYG